MLSGFSERREYRACVGTADWRRLEHPNTDGGAAAAVVTVEDRRESGGKLLSNDIIYRRRRRFVGRGDGNGGSGGSGGGGGDARHNRTGGDHDSQVAIPATAAPRRAPSWQLLRDDGRRSELIK